MQHSMNGSPMERSSEAELKETLERIIRIKQRLQSMCEDIINIQRAFIKLNGIPPYMFEDDYLDDIDGCRRAMYQIETHTARLICWVATEEEKLQNAIKNQEGKKKKKGKKRSDHKTATHPCRSSHSGLCTPA